MPPPPAYLLDTNVLIEYARASIAGAALEAKYQFQASSFKPLVCIVTIGKVWAFAQHRNWAQPKRDRLQKLIDHLVQVDINSRDVLADYADIHTFTVKNGFAIGDNDIWIASAAKATGATLITTDKDFDPLHSAYIRRIHVDPKTGAMTI